MRQGLIHTFNGQIAVAVVFLVLGAAAFVAGMILVFIRKNPPLTTQVDTVTGVKQHGLFAWGLLIACLTMGLPAVFIAVRTLVELVDVAAGLAADHWLITIGVGGLAAGLIVWRLLGRFAPADVSAPPPVAPVAPPVVNGTPVPGWSLPADAPHWADPEH